MYCANIIFAVLFILHKQEFSDPRDADDARYYLNGREFNGTRIIVEHAKGVSGIRFIFL